MDSDSDANLAPDGAGRLEVDPITLSLTKKQENGRDISNSLPSELLGAIFEIATERFQKRYPLDFSQVSVRWRAIALRMPSLWKNIFIQGNLITATELVDIYLERSRQCLLDIDLDLDNCMSAEYWEERIQCQLDRIVKYVGRWRQLAVHGTWRPSFLTFVSRLRDAYAPFLESIVICWNVPHNHADEDIVTSANIFSGGAPRLSTLFISEVNLCLFLPPLTSITSFSLGYSCDGYPVSFGMFYHALIHMPNLKELFVDVSNVEFPDESTSIDLPSLISLEIQASNDTPSEVSDLLTILRTPRLESLLLDRFYDQDISPLIDLFRLSHESNNYLSLRSLELRDVHFSSRGATQLFETIPAVVDVSLSSDIWGTCHKDCDKNSAVLKALSMENTLLPDLRSITLTSVDDDDISSLRAIISNRSNQGRPVSYLRMPKLADLQHQLGWFQEHVSVVFVPNQSTSSSCSARGMQSYAYNQLMY